MLLRIPSLIKMDGEKNYSLHIVTYGDVGIWLCYKLTNHNTEHLLAALKFPRTVRCLCGYKGRGLWNGGR